MADGADGEERDRGSKGRRGGRRGGGRRSRREPPQLSVAETREWLSSYIYGNITVLGAAIAVGPDEIHHGVAIWAVLGTGLLTFFAHVLAHIVAQGFGTPDDATPAARRAAVAEVVVTARPIATSALIPALLYTAAWLGWLAPGWTQAAAVVVLAVRIGFVGVFMRRRSGQRLTFSALWGGVVLAAVALGIGIAKVLLTH